jgi:hypothetical protein
VLFEVCVASDAGGLHSAGMQVWWVNHKQAYRQEIGGSYIWSPKAKSNGSRNLSYDNLRLVMPGDIVLSYANAQVRQLGVVTQPAASCPKPAECCQAGTNWGRDGWIVPVDWNPVPQSPDAGRCTRRSPDTAEGTARHD